MIRCRAQTPSMTAPKGEKLTLRPAIPRSERIGVETMLALAQVAIGGAMGASLRYLAVLAFGGPWTTLAINVLGSFVMGLCYVALAERAALAPLLMTGILGGFTTFSAFSLDALKLMEASHLGLALLYLGGSVILSLVAVGIGVTIARGLI